MSRKTDGGIVVQKKHIVIAAVIALLLVIGGIVLGLNWNGRSGTGDEPPASQTWQPDIDPDAQDWTGELPEEQGGDSSGGGIKIPGYPSITLPADTETVSVALLNPEGNPCYFTFELVLKDTDEVLYTSKLVPPGQAIYEITLSRPLAAGEYDAVIRISTTSLENGGAMNGANVETTLIVQ